MEEPVSITTAEGVGLGFHPGYDVLNNSWFWHWNGKGWDRKDPPEETKPHTAGNTIGGSDAICGWRKP